MIKKEPFKVPSKALKGFAPSSERVDDLMDGKQIPIKNLNKFPVTERAIKNMKAVMEKQDEFGIEKYGKPLNYNMNYDWDAMADEELADFLKYRQCAKERKNAVVQLLQAGLGSDDPKHYIEIALELLTIGGTGK